MAVAKEEARRRDLVDRRLQVAVDLLQPVLDLPAARKLGGGRVRGVDFGEEWAGGRRHVQKVEDGRHRLVESLVPHDEDVEGAVGCAAGEPGAELSGRTEEIDAWASGAKGQ